MSEATEAVDPHAELIHSLIGVTVGERYVIERLLGRGGMGLVLEARHRELDQKVAIKLILPEYSANSVVAARFMREAKVAARVTGRHLVRVFDVGRLASGMPYLAMELLSGNDLDAELSRRGPLPVEEAVDYVVQAALGLAELHAQGVVHRDLKPSNLFISTADGDRSIKILDFGISKEAPGHVGALTGTDTAIGTPSYMSPEQIKTPKEVDPRSDIWSLGVILAELLTQKLPFPTEGASVGELFGIILFREPVAPIERRPDLPRGLSNVVLHCLRKDRDRRYRDVAEFAEALRPFANSACQFRIDAVRRAVGPITAQSPSIVAESASVGEAAEAELRLAADSVPTAVDLMPISGPTQVSGGGAAPGGAAWAPAAISRPAVFAMGVSGRSLVSSTTNVPLADTLPRSRTGLIIGLVAGFAVVTIGFWALMRPRSTAVDAPNAVASQVGATTVASGESATPSVTPTASAFVVRVEPLASAPALNPAASASGTKPGLATPKPHAHAKPAAAHTAGDDLILDRR